MQNDIIFQPLEFRHLTIKNRIFRSNISGRFDNYDGSGNQARINWEEKFARGGVGAIVSSFVPVTIKGRIVPNYATIHCDDRISFWHQVGEKVHEYGCKFIMQLSHSGRQQDIQGIENDYIRQSSTSHTESFHGLECRAMSKDEIWQVVQAFGKGAKRAQEAGLDGVELHGANGYLITQFLSSGINDRTDEFGGSLRNRARFLLEIIEAVRQEVGDKFHFQVKISAEDFNNAVIPWEKPGNKLEETVQICQWLEEAGVDAIHVSVGSLFPHPLNPPGTFPLGGKYATDKASNSYDTMLSSGNLTFRNYLLFRYPVLHKIFEWLWYRIPRKVYRREGNLIQGAPVKAAELCPDFSRFVSLEKVQQLLETYQGRNLGYARSIKKNVKIPVICTGGFQQASYIRKAISEEFCDAVSIARPLVANNDLVQKFAQGKDISDRPCTYCNKCLLNTLKNPLGCYEIARYGDDYNEMIREIMTVFT
ncbi:MAG: NADH:flavin oxidoreductase [Nostoc sp. JL34]|uniref:NADH:flavin oxidoreductase n=1 Tax=Nostoc sp. JL34 TaxID=2815397 RepID=UPI001D7A95B8|nr:NADH:flavin oxidoreductase [Nostoc sp. JL34]MBN3881494.1 NADH:flavin oxidoreductase [Nostoc sp. JL34]